MKKLYLIGGTMGVGKTTTARALAQRLENCVFLDGDWCWDMHPFRVTEATKAVVQDNICFMLNRFLSCPDFDNVVFCWVMHEQAIIDTILSRVELSSCDVRVVSLVCDEEALRKRLQADIDRGLRQADVLSRSVARLPLYAALKTEKIDVSEITAAQAAEIISRL